MVISFFKNSRFLLVLAIPVSCLVFRAFSLYEPVFRPMDGAAPLYAILQDLIKDLPLIASVISVLAVIAGALLLNHLALEFEILNTVSYLPALMYVVLMSAFPEVTTLHPSALANIFLLLVLMKVTGSYRKNEAFSQFFDSGFLLGVSTLFYVPSLVFMPLVWIGLLIFRPFILREWIVGFVGFILPFILTGALFFLFSKLEPDMIDSIIPVFSTDFSSIVVSTPSILSFIILLFITILSFSKINRGAFFITLRARKNKGILFWTLFFGGMSAFLSGQISEAGFLFCTIPLSIIISNYFLAFRKNTWLELLFYSLSLSILANQAFILFKFQ